MRTVYDTLTKKEREFYGESFDTFKVGRQASFLNMIDYGKIDIDSLTILKEKDILKLVKE